MELQEVIVEKILQERDSQDERFGDQPKHRKPEVYLAVMMEELGEVAKSILEKESDNYPIELIQLAAVCIAALEDYYAGNALYDVTDVCGSIEQPSVKK